MERPDLTQPPAGAFPAGHIRVVGARTHNLRNITVSVPKGRIVAFTGVSGSGKSSLVMDTIHAEAQLRYLEGLSPFVRQYITPRDRAQVDRITGLSATLAVDQRKLNRNPRSTLGTIAGLSTYFGLLFSRLPDLDPRSGSLARGLTTAHFDAQTPEGRCETCAGAGFTLRADAALLVPRPGLPLGQGASPWFEKLFSPEMVAVPAFARLCGADLSLPWQELPQEFRDGLLHGTGDRPVEIEVDVAGKKSSGTWTYKQRQPLRGALAEVERLFAAAKTDKAKERYLPYLRSLPCPSCGGNGLGEASRSARVADRTYAEVADATVADLATWTRQIPQWLHEVQREVADTVLPQLDERLRMLTRLGLGHLQLSRTAPSLSGGELQRVRIASQVGTGLSGVIYVLDEPSSGLHPADRSVMSEILRDLRNVGNTVLLVEHDDELISHADWVIDIGPGAGRAGGQLVAAGTPEQISDHPESLTGKFLRSGRRHVARARRGTAGPGRWLSFTGIESHNVRGQSVRIPLDSLTCLTGVSGSGKSSVLNDAIAPAVEARLAGRQPATVAEVAGTELISWVQVVDQQPIGRTPRSTPATYTKAYDIIRLLYAEAAGAAGRPVSASDFSFNVPGGRCEDCQGHGRRLVDMHFMPDVWVVCASCDGRRFKPEPLRVTYRGLPIDQTLELTVADAAERFSEAAPVLTAILDSLAQVGLGYLRLGQSATELSGGEAQRLKLAAAITRGRQKSRSGLILLDEPVTGLHPADVQRIIDSLDALIASGNTVVVAEHNLHVVAVADWVVDLGPGAGPDGGKVLFQGSPEDLAVAGSGATAGHLRGLLAQHPGHGAPTPSPPPRA
jgi:excinuclease ABC subunit A